MTEAQLEQETLAWLAELGYTVYAGADIAPASPNPQRQNLRQAVLTPCLRAALARINPSVPASALDDALARVLELGIASALGANRAFHRLLVGGVPVEYQRNGETVGDFVRLVDWAKPQQNQFWAVNQFTLKGPHHTRRADVVLFINGLPLVVLELKNPADVNATIWKAFEQLQTYKQQIPEVFQYNELLVISDGSQARVGSLCANAERFMQWRTIDGVTLDPLGQLRELETLVRGLLAPAVLLDYLRGFVLFEEDGALVKKIAGYHQFHAVRAALAQVLAATNAQAGEQRGKGGVVWHTQGSGKSITMTCFAAQVMQAPQMVNPTLLVITDRNDLDGQLFSVFSLAQDLLREQPVQAPTRQALRELLANRPSGGIVFATIQKFMPGEEEAQFPQLSARHNIVVMADEAHRTQYGFSAKFKQRKSGEAYEAGYAQHLRDALPNATFVAFTGTPVSSTDRDTRAVFGHYVHVYDMQQAKEDGATVPIYYESRLVKLRLKAEALPDIDAEVDELTEDEEESTQARLKSRWAALESVAGAPPRVAAVAADLLAHFEARSQAQHGKALVVCMSREICVHLYDEITRLRPDWHSPDPEQGAIKIVMTGSASDKALLRPHLYSPQQKKRLEKRFKDPQDPLRLVIVRDMWLTGFDAPCVHTLYVDKPMKGHNLMQAIARVNRVFGDKQGGLVVDYIGIGNELQAAMRDYSASQGRDQPTIDAHQALAVLLEELDVLRGLLHGFDYSGFKTGGHRTLAGAANHLLGLAGPSGQRDGKKRFADHALALSHAFSLCCTLDAARALRDEVAFMQTLRAMLDKRRSSGQALGHEARELAIRQIIGQAVVSEAVVDIFRAVGLEQPNIGLLDDEFLAQVQRLPEKNLAVELLERLLSGEIKARFATNVVQQKRFSELLAGVVARYQNRSIETAQVMEELIAMAHQFREVAGRGQRLGLSEDEVKFYDALADNAAAVRELGDATLKKIAHELTASLRKNVSVDWAQRETVRSTLRLMVKRILRKYKYPPDRADAATELVLEQVETLGEAWA